MEWPFTKRNQSILPESHFEALQAVRINEDFSKLKPESITELQLYNVYRDYMIHEDGLLGSRLGSFLTMNSFLIGASALVLGGIVQVLLRDDLQPKRVAIVTGLALAVHSMLCRIGHIAAKLTAISIHAATLSLAAMRDNGNYRLRHAISRGDLPFLTNGRGLSRKERGDLDRGSDIMRGIPDMMRGMWFLIGIVPVLIYLGALLAVNRGWYVWPKPASDIEHCTSPWIVHARPDAAGPPVYLETRTCVQK